MRYVLADFSDEIANKTLLEKPSTIYQERPRSSKHRAYAAESTSDSEVDSDSGYSSPMHRKHQASGTQSVPIEMMEYQLAQFPPSGLHPAAAYAAAAAAPPPALVNYAQVVAAGGVQRVSRVRQSLPPQAYGLHPTPGARPAAPRMRPAKPQHYHSQERIQPQRHKLHGDRLPSPLTTVVDRPTYSNVVGNATDQQPKTHTAPSQSHSNQKQPAEQQSNSVELKQTVARSSSSGRISQSQTTSFISKTEGEDDEGALSSSSRPRRKRSRRRRKKTDGSESADRQGALSDDGAYDLARAQSSSNVSRTSTLDNEILHFEDENEFPNLLSAVGGLQGHGRHAAGNASISYCDILKGQVVRASRFF